MQEFHAHIYYESQSRQSVEELHHLIASNLTTELSYLGKLSDRPIGPHPVPMFEINFNLKHFSAVVLYLLQHHGNHSVLIHPLSGNDLLDHTDFALWLGSQLPLDLNKL